MGITVEQLIDAIRQAESAGPRLDEVIVNVLINFPRSPGLDSEALCVVEALLVQPVGFQEDESGRQKFFGGSVALVVNCHDPRNIVQNDDSQNLIQDECSPNNGKNVIPELAHYDPGVFTPMIDRPAGSRGRERIPNSGDSV